MNSCTHCCTLASEGEQTKPAINSERDESMAEQTVPYPPPIQHRLHSLTLISCCHCCWRVVEGGGLLGCLQALQKTAHVEALWDGRSWRLPKELAHQLLRVVSPTMLGRGESGEQEGRFKVMA